VYGRFDEWRKQVARKRGWLCVLRRHRRRSDLASVQLDSHRPPTGQPLAGAAGRWADAWLAGFKAWPVRPGTCPANGPRRIGSPFAGPSLRKVPRPTTSCAASMLVYALLKRIFVFSTYPVWIYYPRSMKNGLLLAPFAL